MKIPFLKKKETPQMDLGVAEQMLQNIYKTCDFEPNSVPLDVLTSYSNYRRERYSMQRTVIAVVLTMFLMLPLLFVASKITLDMRDPEVKNPVYDVSVSTRIPVSQINATIDGRSVPVQELGSHQYAIQPDANGDMTITVTLLNQQVTSMEVSVSNVDNEKPVLLSTDFDADCLYLYVEDEGSGVDYGSIYVADENGQRTEPTACDEESGCITINYPTTSVNVIIPDKSGNALNLHLTPK